MGTPYLYASSDPAKGFDCSGFITYVFNHFGIAVPRSSVDFTDVGLEVPREFAAPGDLILFTGTDSTIRIVGHMGIVESNEHGNLLFLHSTSGKAYSVTISPLKGYYESRFVKVIIQYLVHHVAVANGAGTLQKTVSQGGFAVVNMSDNAKITDILQALLFSGGKGS